MHSLRFTLRRLLPIALLALTALAVEPVRAAIPLRQQIDVANYVIHADLDPATGRLNATTTVTFNTLEDLTSVIFGLNNGLQIHRIQSPFSFAVALKIETAVVGREHGRDSSSFVRPVLTKR